MYNYGGMVPAVYKYVVVVYSRITRCISLPWQRTTSISRGKYESHARRAISQ